MQQCYVHYVNQTVRLRGQHSSGTQLRKLLERKGFLFSRDFLQRTTERHNP